GLGHFTRWTGHILEQAGNGSARYFPADLDRDGDIDLLSNSTNTRVYFNDGQGNFVLQQTISASTPEAGDFDNDGDLDVLFVGDGNPRELKVYTNDGTGKLTLDNSVLPETGLWIGGVWVDFDNDGFLDQFVQRPSGGGRTHALLRNQGNANRWLKIRLVGTVSNRSALGAKVRVLATWGGRSVWQLQEITSFLNTPDGLRAHFGLAEATHADVVRIEWPSGTVQEMANVAPNQILTVVEPPAIRVTATRIATGLRLRCETAPSTAIELQRSLDAKHWNVLSNSLTDAEGRGFMEVPVEGVSGFYRAICRQ
ncbi:MAG: CRTAC1 family protein, partial [Nitrospira sp.]|nr:CRTAC1 family protein [Nitrospira sp.]